MNALITETTALEKQSLEAHVDLCAMRYGSLDARLTNIEAKIVKIEAKIDDFETLLTENKRSLATVIIGASATMLSGIIGLIVTILLKF